MERGEDERGAIGLIRRRDRERGYDQVRKKGGKRRCDRVRKRGWNRGAIKLGRGEELSNKNTSTFSFDLKSHFNL